MSTITGKLNYFGYIEGGIPYPDLPPEDGTAETHAYRVQEQNAWAQAVLKNWLYETDDHIRYAKATLEFNKAFDSTSKAFWDAFITGMGKDAVSLASSGVNQTVSPVKEAVNSAVDGIKSFLTVGGWLLILGVIFLIVIVTRK